MYGAHLWAVPCASPSTTVLLCGAVVLVGTAGLGKAGDTGAVLQWDRLRREMNSLMARQQFKGEALT